MVRAAFTMIELIFALVIIGIVFITLPLILLSDSKNVEKNLMQEAIFASVTKMSQILSYRWDDNSSLNPFVITSSNVLTVTNGDSKLDRNISDFRVGHIQQPLHRRMTPASTLRNASSVLGAETLNERDDIDDFIGTGVENLIDTRSSEGYKREYRTNTTVAYVNDSNFQNNTDYTSTTINFTFDSNTNALAKAQTSNIKLIQISTDQYNINTAQWEPILVLRAYSCNIGETDFYKRRY